MRSGNAHTKTMTAEVTVLEMRRETCLVQRTAGKQTLLCEEVPLSADALVRQCLRHEPPWPIELEHAIELTEDAVMPLAAQFAGSAGLILQGVGAALIAHRLASAGIAQTALNLDEVEALFNRLVSVSQGRPPAQETLPTDARFFAAMLILREFMHHLNFAQASFI